MMRKLLKLTAMAAFLALAPAAMAQGNAPIDKTYESSKAAELESVKLQLATSSSPTALAEQIEAESALRRLKEAKAPDLRRRIAAELESALIRLRLEADSTSLRR